MCDFHRSVNHNPVNPVSGNLNLFSFCSIKKVRNQKLTQCCNFTIVLGIKTMKREKTAGKTETAGQGRKKIIHERRLEDNSGKRLFPPHFDHMERTFSLS